MREASLLIIFTIGLVHIVVAWLSYQVFFFYGAHRAAKWIVFGAINEAFAWGFINVGAQVLLPIGSEIRSMVIFLSLIGILVGVLATAIGLGNIYWNGIKKRG